ncbi:putative signal transducing protein [Hyunsoonleella aestuarii]|nr:DUF2007 domain-containing protein [Hyunsoonleella aestuarii]
MTDSNYIKIFTGNLVNAQHIKQNLEDIGINAVIKEQNESNLNPIFGGHLLQEIHVHKDELDEAVKIVESVRSNQEAL